jgi:hypothetical protein
VAVLEQKRLSAQMLAVAVQVDMFHQLFIFHQTKQSLLVLAVLAETTTSD